MYADDNALLVTGRKAEWAGPTQDLDMGLLGGVQTAKLVYAIKLVKNNSFKHNWVVKTVKNGVAKYVTLPDESISKSDGWKTFEKEVEIPSTDGAESVKIYLKGIPVDVEFIIDNVSLETTISSTLFTTTTSTTFPVPTTTTTTTTTATTTTTTATTRPHHLHKG